MSTCVQSEQVERRRHWWARLSGTNVEQRREEYLGGGRWSEVDFLDFPESVADGSAWSSGSLRAQENKSGRKYQLLSFTITFSHVRPAGERGKMKTRLRCARLRLASCILSRLTRLHWGRMCLEPPETGGNAQQLLSAS